MPAPRSDRRFARLGGSCENPSVFFPLVWRTATAAWLALCAIGCGDGPGPAQDGGTAGKGSDSHCLAPLALDCQPAFMPTYQGIYDNLFSKTCGAPGTGMSCHGPNGGQSGLFLSGVDQAYDDLLGKGPDHRARLVPGKPECSIIEQRLESTDPNFRMPVGSAALPEGVRCAVRKWIAMGATK
jgi:Planctomycete cytochrome C